MNALLDQFREIGTALAADADRLSDAELAEWVDLIEAFDLDARNEQDNRKEATQ